VAAHDSERAVYERFVDVNDAAVVEDRENLCS
jgi:hypothetical protein